MDTRLNFKYHVRQAADCAMNRVAALSRLMANVRGLQQAEALDVDYALDHALRGGSMGTSRTVGYLPRGRTDAYVTPDHGKGPEEGGAEDSQGLQNGFGRGRSRDRWCNPHRPPGLRAKAHIRSRPRDGQGGGGNPGTRTHTRPVTATMGGKLPSRRMDQEADKESGAMVGQRLGRG